MLSKRAANPNASVIRVNRCAGYQDECRYCMCQLRPTIEEARGPMVQGRRLSEQERSARNPTLR